MESGKLTVCPEKYTLRAEESGEVGKMLLEGVTRVKESGMMIIIILNIK